MVGLLSLRSRTFLAVDVLLLIIGLIHCKKERVPLLCRIVGDKLAPASSRTYGRSGPQQPQTLQTLRQRCKPVPGRCQASQRLSKPAASYTRRYADLSRMLLYQFTVSWIPSALCDTTWLLAFNRLS